MYCYNYGGVTSGFCRQKKTADQAQIDSALTIMDLSTEVDDEAQSMVYDAGDNQCLIYSGVNYTGDYRVLELPEGENSHTFFAPRDFPNEWMASWRCGAKLRYHFCSEKGPGWNCIDRPDLGESGAGAWNNREMGETGAVS